MEIKLTFRGNLFEINRAPKREMISKSENSLISQKRQQKFVFRRIVKAFPLSHAGKSDGVKPNRVTLEGGKPLLSRK